MQNLVNFENMIFPIQRGELISTVEWLSGFAAHSVPAKNWAQ